MADQIRDTKIVDEFTPHPKVTSVFDFSAQALDELSSWLQQNQWQVPTSKITGYKGAHLGFLNAKEYGATGNGISDDTNAINAAITAANALGGANVVLPAGSYKVTTLNLKPYVCLTGASGNPDSAAASTLVGTAGSNVVALTQSGGSYGWYGLRDLTFSGGLNHIVASDTIVQVEVSRCAFLNPTESALAVTAGAAESWYVRDCEATGGKYFFRSQNVNNSGGLAYVDKTVFSNVVTVSQTVNAYLLESAFHNSVTLENCTQESAAQHGIVFGGAARSIVFVNLYTEGNGSTGKNARTTGSINAGANSLTVASSTGFAIGDSITVRGAGTSRTDLQTTISNIFGTTFTLGALAGITVAAVNVTNAKYDDVTFTSPGGTSGAPSRVTFVGGRIGNEGTNGRLRYAINAKDMGAALALLNLETLTVDVYDPSRLTFKLGGTPTIIQPSLVSTSAGLMADSACLNGNLGFYGTGPIAKPTVTGSKGANAALTSLMTALANFGLVIDSTT